MAQVINTNVMSLNAQRNLNTSSASLSTSIQRLSSGLRINSAKDDAAGLAISERFTTQIRGLDVAVRNANDGISLAQTAEGAMVEVSNNLQRIRELAVQASNATNSDSDRKALQAEVDQLVSEIDRVARQTNFNGTALLDGSFSGALFQIGADAGQTIAVNNIANARKDALGGAKFDSATFTMPAGGTTVSGMTITGSDGKAVTIDTVTVPEGADNTATQKNMAAALALAINEKMDQSGVYAEVDTAGTGLKLSSIRDNTTNEIEVTAGAWKDAADADITLAAADEPVVTSGTDTFVASLDVSSFVGSQQVLSVVDNALTEVNSSRADMGAIQNRFSSTIANLSATSENLSASRSRIRDTDYAKETAELTRTQILQQAGTAMLAQANTSPQSVMTLLQQ
jgi:flagellin